MSTIIGRRVVRASLDDAARLFLDWSQDTRWRAQVRRMTVEPSGQARAGQRIVEELRFAGLAFVTPTRIERAGPTGAEYRGGSAVVAVHGSRHLRALPEGQVALAATLHVRLRGPLRPLTRLLIPSYRRLQEHDLDRLVRILDSGMPGGDRVPRRERPAS